MNTQKLIFGFLIIGVLLGVVFISTKLNNKVGQDELGKPIEIPIKPMDEGGNYGTDWPPLPANLPDHYFTEKFGKSVTLRVTEQGQFVDDYGNNLWLVLKAINDSRCPDRPDVECVWQGELSAEFQISGGTVPAPENIILGTETRKTLDKHGYKFSLVSATESSATISTSK